MEEVGLIGGVAGGVGGYGVYDGYETTNNCTQDLDRVQWTYSAGMLLNTAAVMFSMTGDSMWEDRANGIWASCNVSLLTVVA